MKTYSEEMHRMAFKEKWFIKMQTDLKKAPHWSHSVQWSSDRWDPMVSAPHKGRVTEVKGRTKDGFVIACMHYAHGGGEEQPAFRGWFAPFNPLEARGFYQVFPVEWQPLVTAD